MPANDLSPTPEGKLIRAARELAVPKLSIRAAAARIGISPEHWGNIERGYKSAGAGEPPSPVIADAALIAKMAAVTGVTAGEIGAAGQRPDAAALMRRKETAVPAGSRWDSPGFPESAIPAVRERMPELVRQVATEVVAAEGLYVTDAADLSGGQVFARADEADLWDAARAMEGTGVGYAVHVVALARGTREAVAGVRRNSPRLSVTDS